MKATQKGSLVAGTVFRYLAIAAALVAPALTSYAQVATSAAPPPVRTFIDANGVDLISGSMFFSDQEVSVGVPGQGGMSRAYIGGLANSPAHGYDNLTGTINEAGGGSTAVFTVSLGQSSHSFGSGPGSTFTNLNSDGSTLTQLTNDSTTYIFVDRDGTQAVFSAVWSGGCCNGGNIARVTSITRPNGEVLTYWYTNQATGQAMRIRLDAVTNNYGYEIKYLYAGNDVVNITSVIAIDNTVDYCAPTATTCALTLNWPTINISVNATTGDATVTDNLSRQTTYPWLSSSLIRPSGETFQITYDASRRVTQISNGTGIWKYAYSTSGSTQTTTATDPNLHTRVVVVNTATNTVTSDTDGVGNKTSYAYDSSNRLQTITRQEGDTVGYTYDARGNVTQTVNTGKDRASKITTSANFDSTCTYPAKCNLPNWTKDGKGYETDYTYNNSTGQPLSIIRPAGANGLRPEMDFTYTSEYAWYKNSAGTIVKAASPVSMLTKVSQCATAQTCAGTANAEQSSFVYGTSGVANNLLLTSVTQGAGDGSLAATTGLAYDSIGNLYTQTDPLNRMASFRFDAARQLVGVVGPDPDGAGPLHNRAVRISYECDSTVKAGCDGLVTKVERGTVLSEADSDWAGFAFLGQQVTTYDGLDRKITDIASSGSTYIGASQYSYDPANRLICQTQRMNPNALASLPGACTLGTQGTAGPDRITYLTYDNADRMLTTIVGYGTSVQAIAVTNTYGGDNEVLTRADAKGHLTTFVHDTFNRIYQVELPTPSNGGVSSTSDYEQYTYDNNGNVTQNRRRDGTLVNFGYDALNLRTSGYNGAIYGYDNLGRMTSAVVSGISESFGYDGLNRQISEAGPLGTVGRKYDLVGNLTRLTYPDSYYVAYGYDAANEFTGLTDSNSVTLLNQVYDNLARISSISRTSGPSESRGYGADLRLSSQAYTFADTSKNVTYSYTWNLAGQPMTMTPNNSAYSNTTSPAAASYASDGQNRYTTVGAHTMTYDGRSNLNNDGTDSFVFDGLNRTTTVNSTTFSYDALNRLYQGTKGSSVDRLLYSGQQIIAAYDGSGNVLNRYVPDLPLDRTLLGYPGASTAISGASWLVTNAFGSVVAGAYLGTAAITTYDAFGVSGASGLSPFNGNFGFKGMPSSGSSGIYYARARTYSASLGRFLQPDPAGYTDGLHLYQFAHNSPVNGADPTGLDCTVDEDGNIIECVVTPEPAPPPTYPDPVVPDPTPPGSPPTYIPTGAPPVLPPTAPAQMNQSPSQCRASLEKFVQAGAGTAGGAVGGFILGGPGGAAAGLAAGGVTGFVTGALSGAGAPDLFTAAVGAPTGYVSTAFASQAFTAEGATLLSSFFGAYGGAIGGVVPGAAGAGAGAATGALGGFAALTQAATVGAAAGLTAYFAYKALDAAANSYCGVN